MIVCLNAMCNLVWLPRSIITCDVRHEKTDLRSLSPSFGMTPRVSSVMEKSWNSGKWQNHFPDLEKSWNLKRRQKSWNFKMHHGKIMEFWNFLACYFWDFLHSTCATGHCHSNRSWKMQRESWKIHGKIMEFHFRKWLETLNDCLWEMRCIEILTVLAKY